MGTSARFSSPTPPDSKSGSRSSFVAHRPLPSPWPERQATEPGERQLPAPACGRCRARSSAASVSSRSWQSRHSGGERHGLAAAPPRSPARTRRRCRRCPASSRCRASSMLAQGLRLHLHEGEVHLLDEVGDALLLGVLHLVPGAGSVSADATAACPGSRRGAPPACCFRTSYRSRSVIGFVAQLMGPPPCGHRAHQSSFRTRNVWLRAAGARAGGPPRPACAPARSRARNASDVLHGAAVDADDHVAALQARRPRPLSPASTSITTTPLARRAAAPAARPCPGSGCAASCPARPCRRPRRRRSSSALLGERAQGDRDRLLARRRAGPGAAPSSPGALEAM